MLHILENRVLSFGLVYLCKVFTIKCHNFISLHMLLVVMTVILFHYYNMLLQVSTAFSFSVHGIVIFKIKGLVTKLAQIIVPFQVPM